MAGDWIKLEHATPDKPEVVKLASILNVDQDAIVGKLIRLWIWADQNSVNGNDVSVTDSFIDRLTFCNGFSIALRNVGWLTGKNGCLMLPNFERHNGQTSKSRAVTNRRVARHRSTCNDVSVTDVTDEALEKPLPEKRREDNIATTTTHEVSQFPKDVSEVERFMSNQTLHPLGEELNDCADSFLATFEARGWRDNKGIPVTDWKPLARRFAANWARNNQSGDRDYRQNGRKSGTNGVRKGDDGMGVKWR